MRGGRRYAERKGEGEKEERGGRRYVERERGEVGGMRKEREHYFIIAAIGETADDH